MRVEPRGLLARLRAEYPAVEATSLRYSTPFDLLVAAILSAQCTDERVNTVTETLFAKYRTPNDYVQTPTEELERVIRPTGFYRRKTKLIQAAATMLTEEFDSVVPSTIEALTRLPGVARKTANIVLSNAFNVVEGIAVDTHVLRLARRLGLSEQKHREKVERDLMKSFPKAHWFELSNLLIAHGRRICVARRPRCEACVLKALCPSAYKYC
jgi:endonuclease-3